MFRAVPLIVRRGRTQPLGLIQNSHKVQLRVVKIKRVQRVTYLPFRRRVLRLLCLWDSPRKNTGVGC